MIRILLRHATRYGIRSSRTVSLHTAANQTLQHRIAEAIDRNAQIIPVLQQWRQQGNQVNPSQVRVIIKHLRDSEHSLQALQVSEWMSKEKICNLIPEDFAARLHLIENVVGLEEAEKIFESIPESAKDDSVYTTLLNSYARSDKTLRKAEATFKKMRELGLLSRPSPYNAMMSLYTTLKYRDKAEELLREMQDNHVEADSVTVNHVLKLYLDLYDVTAMEKFLNEWKAVPGIKIEWLTALDMAKAYLRAGSREKAKKMLRLAEESVDPKSLKSAYKILLNLYGEAGEKEEVLRIWNLYKKKIEQCDNNGYLNVICSLLKLHGLAEAEEIYKEWESLPLEFDIRIPTLLANGYRERGMIDQAEKLMNNRTIKNKRMMKPITPILKQWGSRMEQSDLKCLIKNLQDSNQFSKALQVSEWMGEERVCNLYSEDYAARLHLIDHVLGLEEAEKFFENIPENMKDYYVYDTLLSSYAKSNQTVGYGHFHKEMVEKVLCEMEENNVNLDSVTVNKVLRVYADEPKVEAMEKFMRLWGKEDGIKLERGTMVAMAKAYTKAGLKTKAIEMYGNAAGSKREVYRIWNECKNEEIVEDDFWGTTKKVDVDEVCRSVISSLLKLDDVQGAEKVYGEWKPHGPRVDLSIPGLLISRFYAQENGLKVWELVQSIKMKRIGMHFRILKAFAFKLVKRVAIGGAIFCLLVVTCYGKRPWLLLLLIIHNR
ncbi:unnamed protein product [Microthlaspi erraticum]|uniref:Pentacotripeptide-repeat region of PRORP domain-containing protein n=1 Tax=Microthlaspi erraticum TaxID=1685480 RepID=A0A6D2HK09_9BRAS|nr:unnamed protein product [Microthlaspi erraticum]